MTALAPSTTALEWRNDATRLATWASTHLVNRTDVWVQYTVVRNELGDPTISAVTLPRRALRDTTDKVTLEKLERHFRGREPQHLIGLHSVSKDGRCLWAALDFDVHDGDGGDPTLRAEAHLEPATAIWRWLRSEGHDPWLLDSDGQGGLHLILLFATAQPVADVHGFLQQIKTHFKLESRLETFPSSADPSGDKHGNALRLPGRHPRREGHYTRVYSPESDREWLTGREAIECLLSTTRSSGTGLAAEPTPASRDINPRSARPSIGVDIDGVLARYDGWRGLTNIGLPLPGARAFLSDLRGVARVVIYSSRSSLHAHGHEPGITALRLKALVQAWLVEHHLPFDEIFVGNGKPLLSAIIDDRAVSCRPQRDGESAYTFALAEASALVSGDEPASHAFWALYQRLPRERLPHALDLLRSLSEPQEIA